MQIHNNFIDAAIYSNAEKFIFLERSCIYPKLAQQSLKTTFAKLIVLIL
jgi:hypothetical protein